MQPNRDERRLDPPGPPRRSARPRRPRAAERVLIPLAARVVDGLFRLVFATVRWEVEGREHETRVLATHGRALYAVWHQRVPSYLYFFSGNGSAMMAGWKGWGEFGGRIMTRHGYVMARGQSARRSRLGFLRDRGGSAALAAIADHVRDGRSAGLTVDGPRGPAQVVKHGIVDLARETGVPILPVTAAATRRLTLRSWDAMHLPLPFARAYVAFGPPLAVPEDADPTELEACRRRLEEALLRITDVVDRRAARGPSRLSGLRGSSRRSAP